MITDEVFIEKMQAALKAQGVNTKERERVINMQLSRVEWFDRDLLIEKTERRARAYQEQKRQSKKIPLEDEEQIEFVRWFKETYPDIIIMMIRNDGYRTAAEKTKQMQMGLYPGAADLLIVHPRRNVWVEMKRRKGGVQSYAQIAFEEKIDDLEQEYILAFGADDAKDKIGTLIDYLN